MARKSKNPQVTNQSRVIPLDYSKQDFETLTITIVEYTQALRRLNRDVAQRELSKDEVREQYAVTLLYLYSPDDARYIQFIGQAESPAYHNYWSKLGDRHGYLQQKKTRDPTTGFKISDRKLTPARMQRYPHCVVMEHDELGVIILPDLSLRALSQVSIKDIVKAILDANTDIQGLHVHMRPLCEAIIRKVFHFEEASLQQSKLGEINSWEQDVGQLLESFRLTYDNSPSDRNLFTPQASTPVTHSAVLTDRVSLKKGKKRVAEEELETDRERAPVDKGKGNTRGGEDEEEETAGDGSRPSKRSKRSNLEGGGWLDFKKEIGSVDTSIPAPPVFTLPFRNKD